MFGMGGSEIIVILIVALLFLGPDKLPQAAKTISKGIRDIKKQSRSLQQQIESDEQIGGAIRDLKSALRGDEPAPRKLPKKAIKPPGTPTIHKPEDAALATGAGLASEASEGDKALLAGEAPLLSDVPPLSEVPPLSDESSPKVTLPQTAGEADEVAASGDDDGELAAMIKPAQGTVAKGS